MPHAIARRTFLFQLGGAAAAAAAHAVVPAAGLRREVAYERMRAEARMPDHEFLWLHDAKQAALAAGRHVLIIHVPDRVAPDVDNDGVADGAFDATYAARVRMWGAAFASEDPRFAVMLGSLEVVCATFVAARRVFPRVCGDRSWGWFVGPAGRATPFGAQITAADDTCRFVGPLPADGNEFLRRYEAARRLQMLECAAPLIAAMEDAAHGRLPVLDDLTREQVLGLAVPSTAGVPVRGGWLRRDGEFDLGGFLDFLHPVRIARPKLRKAP